MIGRGTFALIFLMIFIAFCAGVWSEHTAKLFVVTECSSTGGIK